MFRSIEAPNGDSAAGGNRRVALFWHSAGIHVALTLGMLKLLGSYALAKLLGFGLVGAIVIYALLSLVTR